MLDWITSLRNLSKIPYREAARPVNGRRTRNGSLAEDLVQQTLLRIHRARGSFVAGSNVLPWAHATAHRLYLDDLHRRQRDVSSEADDIDFQSPVWTEGADAAYEANELAYRLQCAFDRLPSSQRTAFELIRLDGLSHTQAAEALGATVAAIRLRAHRAYVALRGALTELDADIGRAPAHGRTHYPPV